MFDSTLGRFLQRDPIGHGAGTNVYQYAGDNPVTAGDFSGLLTVPECAKKTKEVLDDKVQYNEVVEKDRHIFKDLKWKPGAEAKTDEEKLLKFLLENKASKFDPFNCLVGIECQACGPTTRNGYTTGSWVFLVASSNGGWNGKDPTMKHELIHVHDTCKGVFPGDKCVDALLREIRAYRYAGECKDAASCFERAVGSATFGKDAPCQKKEIEGFRKKADELYKQALSKPVLDFKLPQVK
jgi:hypothetical protein